MAFDFGTANEAQKKAITTTEGPLLMIAGPGTGKTFTVVKRVMYLMLEKQVKPEHILVLCYNDDAAKELRTRISNEVLALGDAAMIQGEPININDLVMGTFHSVFLHILTEHIEKTKISKNFATVDTYTQTELVYDNFSAFANLPGFRELFVYTRHFWNKDSIWAKATKIAGVINKYQEEMVTVSEMQKSNHIAVRALGKMTEMYERLLSERNYVDFSGMLVETFKLLKSNPDVLEDLRERFQYIMVDEYQDTNYVQEQLVLLLGEKHHNICVVGDDDQGLYRFRGATISNIFNFPNHFPEGECKTVMLEVNHRSSDQIVKFYSHWMDDENGFARSYLRWYNARFKKNIRAFKTETKGKNAVVKCEGAGADASYEAIYRTIVDLKKKGIVTDYNQIAFLVKVTSDYMPLIHYLEERGIPTYAPRFNMFFERKEIKQVIGCLIKLNPRIEEKAREHYSELNSYYIECISAADKLMENGDLYDFIYNKRMELDSYDGKLKNSISGILYQLFEYEPFREYVKVKEAANVSVERPARNIAQLLKMIMSFENVRDISNGFKPGRYIDDMYQFFYTYMYRQLFEMKITEYEDDSEYAPSGCISFMTIHQSKGMEFPVVFVGSLNKNAFGSDGIGMLMEPYIHRKNVEEWGSIAHYDFWRLYYTAFSRAKNLLILAVDTNQEHHQFDAVIASAQNYEQADLTHIKAEKVKDVDLKKTFSFTSHLSVYENCALQYYFFREMGFSPRGTANAFFGTLVHETIEDIHKEAIAGHAERITEDNIRMWLNVNYETLSTAERIYISNEDKQNALDQVLRYVAYHGSDWSDIRETEVEISYVEKEYILLGKVDLVKGENGTYELVDFKTGEKPAAGETTTLLSHYEEQLMTYAYLLKKTKGIDISKVHLYYTSVVEGDPYISFNVTEERVEEIIKKFDQIIAKIKKRDFTTVSKDVRTCKFCDMKYYCRENSNCAASKAFEKKRKR